MREIAVSVDVFARIWSLRQEGEDNENAILQRVLWPNERPPASVEPDTSKPSYGLSDGRFGVTFPEGFQIERTYLGKVYRASVRHGQWVLESSGGRFSRLNELSRAIGTGTENAWANWFFVDSAARRRPVSDLRDPNRIRTRNRRTPTDPQDIGSRVTTSGSNQGQAATETTWREDVRQALEELGGKANLERIYEKVKGIRGARGRSLPPSTDAVIRRTLEENSSDSDVFKGQNLFEMAEGKGRGVWALRKRS